MDSEISSTLKYAVNKGFQIHPNALNILENINSKDLMKIIKQIIREKSIEKQFLINKNDFEEFLGINNNEQIDNHHEILLDVTDKITSAQGVEGYSKLFESRFRKLKKIIMDRPESKQIKQISALSNYKSKDDVFLCGLVTELNRDEATKITLEDTSGLIELMVFDKDIKEIADSLLSDQFVMVRASIGKKGGYVVKDIFMPDIPDHTTNKSKSEVFAAFLSDLHVGSKYFMEDELLDFVNWLSSPDPIARKTKFVLIGGDIIEGVGIFPNQDKEILQMTVQKQLQKAFEILDKIPKTVKVFIISGNHDPGRKSLPQPAIPKIYNSELWDRENFFMLSNPAMIALNGVKILMFHGQSIDDIVRTTPGLNYNKPAKVMRHLLKSRHMSPIYGSRTPIAPETNDMMVIDEVPDIMHSGHVHFVDLDMYKGVLIINSGAWQKQTGFQESVGIDPTPGLAVLVNLKTTKVYQKDFKN